MTERPASELPPGSAADRYKEVAALATRSAKQLREHERANSERLREEAAQARERLAASETEREEVVDGVRKRWDHAMEALFDEKWMQVTRMPPPDEGAEPLTSSEAIRMVQASYLQLRETLGHPRRRATSWLPRRRAKDDSED